MSLSPTDSTLLSIVESSTPRSIAEVLAIMNRVDAALPGDDGLKWFNLLYLKVTQDVQGQPPAGGWQHTVWLNRLDVVFAQLYFAAISKSLRKSLDVPRAWRALFDNRSATGVERIQFALAGMNAHINRDLALALLQADEELHLTPTRIGPEHDDFEHVNDLLERTLPGALAFLATGVLGQLAEESGHIGSLIAMWNVRAARDLAWDFAGVLRPMSGIGRLAVVAIQDQTTGALG